MILPIDSIASVALIILMGYTVYGLTGFGSTITALPLLVLFMPLQLALPVMLMLDLAAGLMLGLKNRRSADLREFKRLMPFLLIGLALGVTVLVRAPEKMLQLVLGVFVLVYSAWSLMATPGDQLISSRWSAAAGIGGGVFTALFGTGGPIYTIYLSGRVRDKLALRATISLVILSASVTRLVVFSSIGLLGQRGLLPLVLLLFPCSWLGLFLGTQLHKRMQPKHAMKIVWAILILGGVNLVRQGLRG